eukprot:SAG31_NODE_4132_length_3553_cov_2.749855_4_plen_59_part_01
MTVKFMCKGRPFEINKVGIHLLQNVIKGGDMKDFIKHNAKLLKGHDGYATNLRNDDALE